MKILNKFTINSSLLAALLIVVSGCERELSDNVSELKFASTAEVYTDNFIGMGSDFYLPFADARPDVFSIDDNEGFESNSSIRIDVPNDTDPKGPYAGAILRVDGAGRDLTGYNALTFYMKASQGVVLSDVGFGIDYLGDKHQVTMSNITIGTPWSKVIVPIPDASKLLQERGVFWLAAETSATGGLGYVLWIDEIKFEKISTLRQVQSNILDGATSKVQAFVGSTIQITGLNSVFNLPDGQDVTIAGAPGYYEFSSSDTSVASVSELGEVTIKADGTADITATVGGVPAIGKLEIGSEGALPRAPTPTHPEADVLSLFSDAYTPAADINFDPRFGGSNTVTTLVGAAGNQVLDYKSNNYTGIMFDATPLDGSDMNFLHVDVYVQDASGTIGLEIRDIGGNKMLETDESNGNPIGDDKEYRPSITGFTSGAWKSFDIPLAGNIASQKANLGALIIVDGPDNFIFDNIYFYKQ
jgi:hypothetical protein